MSDKKWLLVAGLTGVLWMLPCGTPVIGEALGSKAACAAQVTTPTAAVSVLRVPRGGSVSLPIANVTRVIPADDDVARGSFTSRGAILEGVTLGSTTVDIVTRDGQRQRLRVEVVDPKNAPPILPGEGVKPTPMNGEPVPNTVVPNPVTPNGGMGNTGTSPIAVAPPTTPAPTVPGQSPQLSISLRLETPQDNRSQALATITYENKGVEAKDVVVRYTFDDTVSYISDSATNGGRYDGAARELSWHLGTLPSGGKGAAKFRVAAVDPSTTSFESVATIEEASGVAVISETRTYYFTAAPLIAAFALPDRFLAGQNLPQVTDMTRGSESGNAVDRLRKAGVLKGESLTTFNPNRATQRAEYIIMTLNGLNVRDLRDLTAVKFVLGRKSVVDVVIRDANGKVVRTLQKGTNFDAGEQTVVWDGTDDNSRYVTAGTYTYDCSAQDATNKDHTRLQGKITVVPQTPLNPTGAPTFTDVKPSDWYSGYLALAERQNLARGYPDKTFQPTKSISRVEATVIVIRALGLEDLAKQYADTDSGFFDYEDIPRYGVGAVNVATTLAKTQSGKIIVGYPGNKFLPLKALRRDEAAMIVQRMIDKDGPRKIPVSGQIAPGSRITMNGQTVRADDGGRFSFTLEQNEGPTPVTISFFGSGS